MLCDKCGQEIETCICPKCGQNVLRLGHYCYLCGGTVGPEPEREVPPEPEDDIDFAHRILCSDGTCIGVINAEGVCKVCGKPYTPES